MAGKPPRVARADEAVAVLPPPRHVDASRLIPSGRSTAVALAVVVIAAIAYVLARETSMFAVGRIDVVGAPPDVAAQIRTALRPFVGRSLVTLDGDAVEGRLAELPVVASGSYDRDFPHTLRVFVEPELPVAVLRRGADAWLVSARTRVMGRLSLGEERDLPRVWVKRKVVLELGGTITGEAARAVKAVVPLRQTKLAGTVASARADEEGLTLVLRSGLELRLGSARQLELKLAVGARIASAVGRGSGYVDLTLPGRPVAAVNPQVGD